MDHMNHIPTSAASRRPGQRVRTLTAVFSLLFIPLVLTGCLQVASTKPPATVPQTMAQTSPVTQPVLTTVPAPNKVGVVNGTKVNLRSEPSTAGEVLGQVLKGETLVILKANHTGDWHQVEYNGEPAFIRADLIDLESDPAVTTPGGTQSGTQPGTTTAGTGEATSGKVNTGTVNIREAADQSSDILARVYGGAILKVTKPFYAPQWHQVEFEGETGYVHVDLLDLGETE